MKQTLLAVSVAAALVAPGIALADSSNVSLYGRLAVGVESIQAKGATQTTSAGSAITGATDLERKTRVTDSLSFIGLKGEEEINDDTAAIFQIESYVKPDDGCYYTACSDGNATLATANSFVGLRTAYGTIHFGRNNMYYDKHVPNELHLLRSGTNTTALAILGNNGISQSGVGLIADYATLAPAAGAAGIALSSAAAGKAVVGAATTFYSVGGRVNNQLWYKSPVFNNVTVQVAYAAGENKGTAASTAFKAAGLVDTTRVANSSYAELAAIYMTGNMFGSVTYMQEKDPLFSSLNGTLDKATGLKAAFGYQLPSQTRLGVVVEQQTNTVNSTTLTKLQSTTATVLGDKHTRNTWTLAASKKMGDLEVVGTYGQTGNLKLFDRELDKTGAKFFQLTGLYSLGKNANLYATYAKVTNDDYAAYNFFVQGAATANAQTQNASGTTKGVDPTSISLGVNYTF